MEKFVVIGGQYAYKYYGVCASLNSAKILAAKNEEYWDNFGGYHRPYIYKIEDCKLIETSADHPFNPNQEIYVPKIKYMDIPCNPYMTWNGKRWLEFKEED